jgi:hypothetical protein
MPRPKVRTRDPQPPGRALLVREPYLSLILMNKKRWELRGRSTNIRGRIALIRSGSGLVVGECEIVDCQGPIDFVTMTKTSNLSAEERRELIQNGHAPYLQKDGLSSKTYAWVVSNPILYTHAVPYRHPSGAVTFVDLVKPGVL